MEQPGPETWHDEHRLLEELLSCIHEKESRERMFELLERYVAGVLRHKYDISFQGRVGQSDISQQVLLKVSTHLEDFRGHTAAELKAWVKTILTNELQQVRRTLHAPKRDIHRERRIDAAVSDSSPTYDCADSLPTPATRASNSEQEAKIVSAVDRLPDDYRLVIRLRTWEKRSFADIAAQMARSENAVTKLWFRALVQLQAELEKGDNDPS